MPLQTIKKAMTYLESGLATIPDGVAVFDKQGRFVYVNPTVLTRLGRKKDDLIGKTLIELSPPIMSSKVTKAIAERVKKRLGTGKSIVGAEIELIDKDGKLLPVSYSAAAIRDKNGKIVGEIAFLRDITERKLMEEKLRESEEKFRTLFENANDAIFTADPKTGIITDVNKAGETLLGRSRKEIIGMNRLKLHPPGKAEYYKKHFKKHVGLGHAVDFDAEVITKKGKVVPVAISSAVTTIGGKRVIQGIFRDITERKRAEEERKRLTRELVVVSGTAIEAVKKMSETYRKRVEDLERLVEKLGAKVEKK